MQEHHFVDVSAFMAGPEGAGLRARLATQENVLAVVPVDLTLDLRFGAGWIALTTQRIVASDPASHQISEWPLSVDQGMRLLDHGGVGNLELHDPHARQALWRFTLRHQAGVLALMQQFDRQRERLAQDCEPVAQEE